jgi:hypothetical protein
MKSRRLAIYGLTAGLLGGGAAGLALSGTALTATRIADVTSTDSPAAPAAPAPGSADPRGDWAKSALDPLVAKGTITQAQEDAVLAALQAAKPDHGGPGHGGPGFGHDLDAAAKALGMASDDLRTALQGGKSLADVAESKGVDPAKVVDALVAELKTHLASEVASGEHTPAQADQILADAKTRITDFVNGTAPAGGPGFGGPGGGHRGHGPGGPGAPAGAPANGSGGSGSSSGSGTTTTS